MTLRARVAAHPLAAFFLVAYGFSWAVWLTSLALYPPGLPPARRAPGQLLTLLGTFGPLVAGAVVASLTGDWAAFRARLLHWRVAPRWYVVAVGLPVAVVAIAYGLYRLLGGLPVSSARAMPLSALATTFVFTLLLGGGNEEPGWRGFALPRLQARYGAFVGTFVLAVLWAGWHAPAFLDPASSQSLVPPAAWLVGVFATSYVLTWLFNVADGSVPVAALYHATFNVAGLWVLSALPVDVAGDFYWVGVVAFALFALVVVAATRAGLGRVREGGAAAVR